MDGVDEDRLWTVQDVSYYLGIPVATLYQWRCAGRGPQGRRIGRYVRYRPADVKTWVASLGGCDAA
jgi:predicted DNA-binding transcriptional regulator AlpA